MREFPMLKFTMSAVGVIAIAACAAIVPASADYMGAAPIHNAQGKCWKDTGGPRDARYGFWTDCPKAASVSDSTCHLGQLAWEKLHVGMQYFDICPQGANTKEGAAKPSGAAAKPKTGSVAGR
jgi:hypothetical protein